MSILYFCTYFVHFLHFVLMYFCTLFGLSIQTSMQNLKSVAQKMAELLQITKFILRNLSGQSVRTSMQNLEVVAQKMAEFLHNYVIITF